MNQNRIMETCVVALQLSLVVLFHLPSVENKGDNLHPTTLQTLESKLSLASLSNTSKSDEEHFATFSPQKRWILESSSNKGEENIIGVYRVQDMQDNSTDKSLVNHRNWKYVNVFPKDKMFDNELKKRIPKRRRNTHRHGHSQAFQRHHKHFSQELHKSEQESSFDESLPSHVTSQMGSRAFLSCRIRNLNDKSVSWIRNSDSHILTIDKDTFISDSRFVTLFDPATDTWTLQIKFVSTQDSGRYECQVSSAPKKSHFVTLEVIAPQVKISGGPELYVRSGSDVVLKCVISRALTPPTYVFWYHNQLALVKSFEGLLPQSSLKSVSPDSSVASLRIKNVESKHAGNYTCAPSSISTSDSTLLHVINGEHPAAMQHGINSATMANIKNKVTSMCAIVILSLLTYPVTI